MNKRDEVVLFVRRGKNDEPAGPDHFRAAWRASYSVSQPNVLNTRTYSAGEKRNDTALPRNEDE